MNIQHLLFASTSSVYGNENRKCSENFSCNTPIQFYAATKKSNEVMAYSYSNIYKLPCTGLRFFTIYGPYGRPDMALFKFVKNINSSKKINLFNRGHHYRDFTYIDDIVESIIRLVKKPSKNKIPYEVYNIGGSKTHHLKKTFLKYIEEILNKKAIINNLPMQVGDVFKTHADTKKLQKALTEITHFRDEVFPSIHPKQGTAFNTSLMDWLDMRNSLLCAEAICLAASKRKESRGAHQMEDIPVKSDEFTKNQIISEHNGLLVSSWKAVQKLDFDLEVKSLTTI